MEGHSLIVPTQHMRHHVDSPLEWAKSIGTDYHMNCNESDMVAAGGKDLADHGWEAGGFGYLAGSGSDFLANGGTPGGFNFDTANDYLISPFIFGDQAASEAYKDIMLVYPTTMTLEVFGRFAANADENATGFGLLEAGGGGGSPADADMMAFIGMGATNFEIIRGDGTVDASIGAFDTDPHVFKMVITGAVVTWYIDGVTQGTIAVQDNLWPTAFVVNTETGGVGDPVLSWCHIFYS